MGASYAEEKNLVLIILICATASLWAGNKLLTFQASLPADSAQGVAVDSEIVLEFSNNVVNMSIAEHNKTCVILRTAEGEVVPSEVKMGDD